MVNVLAIIQARIGSTRLQAKSMLDLAGKPLLSRVIESVADAQKLDAIVVACPDKPEDDIISHLSHSLGIAVFRGSSDDVYARYIKIANMYRPVNIVRITADNPLTDSIYIDLLIDRFKAEKFSYAHFIDLPYGSAVEIFSSEMLSWVAKNHNDDLTREHVTYHMKHHFKATTLKAFEPNVDLSIHRVTIDTLQDYRNQYFFHCFCEDNHKKPSIDSYLEYINRGLG